MLANQRPFAILTALVLTALIVYLIRKRKLREEYALLWLIVGAGVIALAVWYGALLRLTRLIGAVAPTTTLFIFAILFLLVLAIHFSISHSRLSDQIKDLTQELAMIRKEMEELKAKNSSQEAKTKKD